MPERSRRWQETCVRAIVRVYAARDGIDASDPQVEWVRAQAIVCVREGMPASEAVRLAWDLAFRHYGLPPD